MEGLRAIISLPTQQVDILANIDQYRVSQEVGEALDEAYRAPDSLFKKTILATYASMVPRCSDLEAENIRNFGTDRRPVLELTSNQTVKNLLIKSRFVDGWMLDWDLVPHPIYNDK
jgi:hypothetical protein